MCEKSGLQAQEAGYLEARNRKRSDGRSKGPSQKAV